jgi:hypothetical protein
MEPSTVMFWVMARVRNVGVLLLLLRSCCR